MALRFKVYVLPLLLFFAVTACAARRPPVDSTASLKLPDEFSVTSATLAESSVVTESGEWWKAFGDTRLNELMDSAFSGNLDIAIAYERVKAARAVAGVARGAEALQLNLTGNRGRSKVFGTTADKYSRSGVASYELDIWGRLSATTEAARKDMVATAYDLRALYISLSAELAESYYVAVERSLQLKIARLMVETAKERYTLNADRYKEGLVSARELFIAQEGVAVAKTRTPAIEAELAGASHAVAIFTGSLPNASISGLGLFQPVPPDIPALLPSGLLKRRPDLQAALHRVEANNSRVGAAIAERFPSFSLTGDYGEASASLGSLVSSPNVFWSLLLQASLPVLDGGRRKAEVLKSKAIFNESLLEYRKALLNALKDVEGALEENRVAVIALPLAKTRVNAASGALDEAVDKYGNGVGGYIDVLTERQRLYEAMSGLVSAKRTLISARISLIRSLGGDFMEKRILERAAGAGR